jgi:hypothetical protein
MNHIIIAARYLRMLNDFFSMIVPMFCAGYSELIIEHNFLYGGSKDGFFIILSVLGGFVVVSE